MATIFTHTFVYDFVLFWYIPLVQVTTYNTIQQYQIRGMMYEGPAKNVRDTHVSARFWAPTILKHPAPVSMIPRLLPASSVHIYNDMYVLYVTFGKIASSIRHLHFIRSIMECLAGP